MTVLIFTWKGKNVEFIGKINYDAILKRTLNCDIIFALYNPKIPNHKYASPIKLFEAMIVENQYSVCWNINGKNSKKRKLLNHSEL